ncbi:prepilin peptidase [Caulobacter segnis]|uniref:prepilin peptidase n=1 Tax=Caulobacter segnis TaxID=88688 RepID=UPI00285548F8|nr:prepilin peptidase [Caulobacter segnis]MDR6624325.1 leader peptidase (prepilin peptidase)/N-methyltransferase [Caulobacter segnis]
MIMVAAAALGPVVGSYVTTAAVRSVTEGGPRGARSCCDGCGRRLSWRETTPLISYAWLRGRCRTCEAPIPVLHPLGEACGLLAAVATAWATPDHRAVGVVVLAAVLLAASVVDLSIRILPDLMVAIVAICGTSLAALHGLDVWLEGVVAGAATLLILGGFSLIYERRRGAVGLGMGDVKLFAALALWLGAASPWMVLSSMVLGLVVAAVSPPIDRKIVMGPMIAVSGFAIGLLLEAGIWPRL